MMQSHRPDQYLCSKLNGRLNGRINSNEKTTICGQHMESSLQNKKVCKQTFLTFCTFGMLWVLFSFISKYCIYETPVPSPAVVQISESIPLLSIEHSGRLGNEMYEYAALLALAHATNRTPVLDPSFRHLNDIFKLSVDITLRPKARRNMTVFTEEKVHIVEETVAKLKNISGNVMLRGYFQYHRYFKDIKDKLRREFTFRDNVIRNVYKYFNDSSSISANVTKIGIHVRRTDLATQHWIDYGFGPPERSYFKNAMDYFRVKYGRVRFIICSDDTKWVKTHLSAPDVTIVSGNSAEVDMAILASCDHIIVSNGTFSWWAGWLCLGTTVYYKRIPPKGTMAYNMSSGEYWPPDDKFNHYVAVDSK